ncbi:hypothetical protein BJ742DRAFT_754884 [Cladochytrium replicatum]|nr:hypothetical protein BJ742DRAFT_754884 [Cladochytrium replicatum]
MRKSTFTNSLSWPQCYIHGSRTLSTCTAITFSDFGQPQKVLSLRTLKLPKVTPETVRVRFLAAPINPADINQIQGTYPSKPRLLSDDGVYIGGNEGVAEVIECGDEVKHLKAGDWVIPASTALGTWRTHATVHSTELLRLPIPHSRREQFSVIAAATLNVNPPTAYRMLKDFQLSKPSVIIQNAANSGVGTFVIQFAKLWGIKTINVVRDRPDWHETVRSLKSVGADWVVKEEDVISKRSISEIGVQLESGPSLALNCVGGKSATAIARSLCEGGTMVTYGGMSMQPLTLPVSLLIFRDISLRGFWMTRWYQQHPPNHPERDSMLKELVQCYCDEKLSVPRASNIQFGEQAIKSVELGGGKKILLFN